MKLKADNRPQITVVGGAYTEIILKTGTPVSFDAVTVSGETDIIPGGPAACIAAALARLRCRVYLVSCTGTDPFSGILLNHLQQQGVNLDYVERSKSEPTGLVHHIISNKGSVQRIYSHGASMKLSPRAIDRAGVAFSVSDLVIVTPDIPRETFLFAIDYAHHFKSPVLAGPDTPDGLLKSDIHKCDILAPDASAAAALCGWEIRTMGDATRCAARLLNQGAGGVAIHLGPRGAVAAISPDEPSIIPAQTRAHIPHPYEKSAFDSGLAWGLALGYKLPEAAWIGMSCSQAIRRDQKNPFDALPLIDDLTESLSLEIY